MRITRAGLHPAQGHGQDGCMENHSVEVELNFIEKIRNENSLCGMVLDFFAKVPLARLEERTDSEPSSL